jgi:hypothetical protein
MIGRVVVRGVRARSAVRRRVSVIRVRMHGMRMMHAAAQQRMQGERGGDEIGDQAAHVEQSLEKRPTRTIAARPLMVKASLGD